LLQAWITENFSSEKWPLGNGHQFCMVHVSPGGVVIK
jgi:hypothetical protein